MEGNPTDSGQPVPAAYDPDMGIPREEWEGQPEWKKGRLSEMNDKRKAAESDAARERGAREQLSRDMAEMRQQITALSQNGNGHAAKSDQPETMDDIPIHKLKSYVTNVEKTRHLFAIDPGNDALKEQMGKIDVDLYTEAQVQLARRAAQEVFSKHDEGRKAKDAEADATNRLQRLLYDKFGDDVLRPKSDLAQAAAEEFEGMSAERSLLGNGAAMLLAFERADRRVRGSERLRDTDMQRLNVESSARREAQPFNSIARLQNKGDRASRAQAVDEQLNIFARSNYSG